MYVLVVFILCNILYLHTRRYTHSHHSVSPATLITQARLRNCVGSSIVLAIGSLLLLYRKGPLSCCSTMSNKSWGGEHRCWALTATQKRGIWEEAAEDNEQYFNSAV